MGCRGRVLCVYFLRRQHVKVKPHKQICDEAEKSTEHIFASDSLQMGCRQRPITCAAAATLRQPGLEACKLELCWSL